MCGRYSLTRPDPQQLMKAFGVQELPELLPRFNIAPTQPAPIVRLTKDKTARELVLAHFGLIPHWSKDASGGAKMINARAESAMDRPPFRDALERRRCLVPADGFFEWKKLGPKKKQPYWLGLPDHQLFAFAGLWSRWRDAEGKPLDSFAILTTEPNALAGTLHDRMPVILEPDRYEAWLDPAVTSPALLSALLQPIAAEKMIATPVSARVNNVINDDPACVDPAEPEPEPKQGSLF